MRSRVILAACSLLVLVATALGAGESERVKGAKTTDVGIAELRKSLPRLVVR